MILSQMIDEQANLGCMWGDLSSTLRDIMLRTIEWKFANP